MAKAKDAFRTISEAAAQLDTPAHVLRFWETKFSQIKPVKRAGGRRYYRPSDLALLAGLKELLHEQGLTIKGTQKLLREKGVKHVVAIGADKLASNTADMRADSTQHQPVVAREIAEPDPAPQATPPVAAQAIPQVHPEVIAQPEPATGEPPATKAPAQPSAEPEQPSLFSDFFAEAPPEETQDRVATGQAGVLPAQAAPQTGTNSAEASAPPAAASQPIDPALLPALPDKQPVLGPRIFDAIAVTNRDVIAKNAGAVKPLLDRLAVLRDEMQQA